MKIKTFVALAVLASAIPVFALPPPKVSRPKQGGGPKLIPVLRDDFLEPSKNYKVSPSPSRGMANAVFISGAAATGLKLLNEFIKGEEPEVKVGPPGVSRNQIFVTPTDVKKDPEVPISVMPVQIIDPHIR